MSLFTLQVMKKRGYDLGDQYSSGVGQYLRRLSIQTLITLWAVADKNSPAIGPGLPGVYI